jgi:tetratricopeptide (TPR) repeat protein
MLGDYKKSIELGISSVKAAPNSVSMWMNLGLTYNYSGEYQKGLESCDTGERPEGMPAWSAVCVAEAYVGLEDFENAARYATAALSNENLDQTGQALMALVLGRAGDTDRAQEIRTRLEELARSEYVSPTTLAFLAFATGDIDRFFSFLEIAIAEKATWAPWFATVPHFASVRDDPRFTILVAKLNFP